MPKINKALAILAALAFLLPFTTISCNGMKLVEMSGAKLAQCSVSDCSPDDFMSPNLRAMAERYTPKTNVHPHGQQGEVDFSWSNMIQTKDEPNGANYVLLAAIACLIALGSLFLPARIGEILSGAASVAAILFLILFRSKFGVQVATHAVQMNTAAPLIRFELQFSSGFWLSVIMSAASAILAFKGSLGVQRFVPVRATPSRSQPTSVCPACGAANPIGNKFCLSCGGTLLSPPPPAPPANRPGVGCGCSAGGSVTSVHRFCYS